MSSIVYPREALLDGVEGEVLIEFTVTGSGESRTSRSSPHRTAFQPRRIDRGAVEADLPGDKGRTFSRAVAG